MARRISRAKQRIKDSGVRFGLPPAAEWGRWLNSADWTPRELRHSFVSLLSDYGVSIEDIADLCGNAGTSVTETVYRHQLRPVLLAGAAAMDRIFAPGERGSGDPDSHAVSHSHPAERDVDR
jgi:integrase